MVARSAVLRGVSAVVRSRRVAQCVGAVIAHPLGPRLAARKTILGFSPVRNAHATRQWRPTLRTSNGERTFSASLGRTDRRYPTDPPLMSGNVDGRRRIVGAAKLNMVGGSAVEASCLGAAVFGFAAGLPWDDGRGNSVHWRKVDDEIRIAGKGRSDPNTHFRAG